MPMPSNSKNRFDMLINVSVMGEKGMGKLAASAKKVAAESGKLSDGLEKLGKTNGLLAS